MYTVHFVYAATRWWHMGWFCLSAVMSSAAINIRLCMWTRFASPEFMLRSGIAQSNGDLCVTVWEISRLFPKWLHRGAPPPAVSERSDFSTSSLTLAVI